jgi:DNA repair photolyase
MNRDDLKARIENPRGRGAAINPANRFLKTQTERDFEQVEHDEDFLQAAAHPKTEYQRDFAQSIVSENDSPDLPFRYSVNPYRGCAHGCGYCYARPTHEYLGFSAGLDFESRIMVKEDAPELLRRELGSPKWKPQALALSGVTDPYQPVERRLQITRRCLAVLAECRNPVGIVTKNRLVTRDLDHLRELAKHNAVCVFISLTTLDPMLRTVLEPRTSPPAARLAAIRELSAAGIPVGVLVAPIIPAINDHEIPRLLQAAMEAGAKFASYVVLRLPLAVAPLFEEWLGRHFPDRKDKVLNQVRALRGGALNDAQFGSRMSGSGTAAERIRTLFAVACRHAGIPNDALELSTAAFRRPLGNQLALEL